jgi:hypothetical protein
MDDAVRERDDPCRIRYGHVDGRAAFHSTRRHQAAHACFDPGIGIALRRSRADGR